MRLSNPLRVAFLPALFGAFFSACVPQSPERQTLRVEDRPLEDNIETMRQGLLQCDPAPETGYTSGSPFEITVVTVDGRPAEIDTANAYYHMQQAAAAQGVPLRVVSGFRSNEQQAYLYSCYVNCSCNNCNLAARPGYSNHQSGSALDLNTYERGVLSWLNRNGATYGFYRTVPVEDWHWEFFGPPIAAPICGPGVAPTQLAFVSPQNGGHYQNGIWLKVAPIEGAQLMRYFADGWFLGASENAADDFSLRYTFNQLGARQLEARAYDAAHNELARGTINITVTEGAQAEPLSFVALTDGGWYRNGVTMQVEASSAASVTYYAGAFELGRSTNANDGFLVDYVFNQFGYRAITAVAQNTRGEEVGRRAIEIRVLPGREGPVALRIVAPQADRSYPGSVTFKAVASDSIAQVVYSADGWTFASAPVTTPDFEAHHVFSHLGDRTILAQGYDAAGRLVAEDSISIRLQP